MPKRLYQLNDFSGGLNTVKDIADIADNETSYVVGFSDTKPEVNGGWQQ